ncbi:hypothetical protein C8Q74DRAFT_1197293 [Fomes fomentarius]|nr:hypothetical protein C8Q74DRAFT_1197293 [Fomes fomentarius]
MAELTGVHLDLMMGVILVGLIVTAWCAPVTTAQSAWYFRLYPQDRTTLKFLVAAVWVIEATHLGLYSDTFYTFLVYKKALTFGQDPLPWYVFAPRTCDACAICLIQSFYASRVWALSKRKLLLAIMSLFIMATWSKPYIIRLVVSIAHFCFRDPYSRFTQPWDIAMSAMTASTDVLLCSALVLLLSTSRTGTEGSDRLINRLMIYAVRTGLFTSLYATLSLIFVLIMPAVLLFVMFYYIGSRFYTVSLLATLNAHQSLRVQAERMGERTLPEIQVTQRLTNKHSMQLNMVIILPRLRRRPDSAVLVPHLSSTATSTTGDDSRTAMTPSPMRHLTADEECAMPPSPRIYCNGARCYTESSFGYDFGQMFSNSALELSEGSGK